MLEQKKEYKISFFFPAFNDEGTIEEMVEEGRKILSDISSEYEIIIVNDGSIDNTGIEADKMAEKHHEVKVVHHLYNIGYGAALKTGFASAQYDLIFYTDGDHQFNLQELKSFMEYIDEYDIVSGYRENRAYSNSKVRKFASKLYNLFIRLFFNLPYKDVDCAFKLIKKDVVERSGYFVNSAFICTEIFYEALKLGKTIKQIPVKHYPRKYGTSSSFSLFFILRSVIELFEALWEVKYKERFYAFRQRRLKRKAK
ncbi:MAG: glycosyltransferase family 2 protein [Elusimicrobiota bacterium]